MSMLIEMDLLEPYRELTAWNPETNSIVDPRNPNVSFEVRQGREGSVDVAQIAYRMRSPGGFIEPRQFTFTPDGHDYRHITLQLSVLRKSSEGNGIIDTYSLDEGGSIRPGSYSTCDGGDYQELLAFFVEQGLHTSLADISEYPIDLRRSLTALHQQMTAGDFSMPILYPPTGIYA